jgi:TonB-dependent receptor
VVENDYTDTLPSLNVTAELTDDFLLRFGAAKVMSRPDYGSLAPGATGNFTTTFIINVGAPDLDPIRATTYDLQAEWYFAEDALLSVGVFYKDIDTFIQGLSQIMNFSETGLPDSLLRVPPNCTFTPTTGQPLCAATPDTPFRVTGAVNTPGGPLQGFEVNYQQPFSFLPGILGNFGVLANYTYVDSEITYYTLSAPDNPATPADERGPVKATLTGLSKNAYNGTLYYEDDRVSARVSASYRDDYITSVQGLSTGHDVRGTDGTLFFDASGSFNISDNLRLTFEALNLTDEFQRLWVDSGRDDTLYYNHSGRTFVFGATFKY